MSQVIHCPACQRQLQLPDELSGQKVRCPSCSEMFVASFGTQQPSNPESGLPVSTYSATTPPVPPTSQARSSDSAQAPTYKSEDDYDDRADYDEDDYEEYIRHRRRGRRRDLVPHRGGLILAMGIIGLVIGGIGIFLCPWVFNLIGLILGIVAWVMGGKDLREIQEGRMDPDGQGITQGGWICGIISTIGNALIFIVCGVIMAIYAIIIAAAAAGGGMK